MAAENDELLELAGAICDGRSVDWDVSPGAGDDPKIVAAMRLVAELAQAHRDETATGLPPEIAVAGQTIGGRYRLLERIGEGGFGSVFLAEQREPVRREVALKVVKLGMDTRQVIARFEAERQALAMMDHPSIAKILDAGATESGRPYFVMDLVRGEPITVYCDRRRATVPERLALFTQVCHAVQHAHQKGIIHRDLKPSNVLVTEVDGIAVPKLIDFGIAKATGGVLTEKTLHTQLGHFIGTPLYMSPEQVGGAGVDVDTRSDVYSLGVLLYELLTGTTPFAKERVRAASPSEIERMIREEEPPRPSARLATANHELARAAERRRTSERQLTRDLQGDLDWIVVKCLEKDRARRYGTVNGLALDVQRFLRSEPVLAGAPSAGYRFVKFVRRHRVGVTAAAIALVLLIAGIVGTSLGMVRARAANRKAQAEAAKARAVSDFLTKAFSAPDPGVEGRNVKVVDVLDGAVREIDTALAGQPETAAALRFAIGDAYEGLGLFKEAETLLHAAMDARVKTLGPDAEEALRTSMEWAAAVSHLGNYQPAIESLHDLRARSAATLGPEHPTTLTAVLYLVDALKESSKGQEAEAEARTLYEVCRRTLPEADPLRVDALNELASVLWIEGKNDEAIGLYRELLGLRERYNGAEAPLTINAMNDLGTALANANQIDAARDLFRRALEASKRVRGEAHPGTLQNAMNFASVLAMAGDLPAAEKLLRETIEVETRVLGPEHRNTLLAMNALGENLRSQGRLREAEETHRRTLEGRRHALGKDHLDTLTSTNNLAATLDQQKKFAEAEPLFREAVKLGLETLGEANPYALSWLHNLANDLYQQGRYDDAEPIYRQAYTLAEKSLPEGHYYRAAFRRGLGLCQLARHDEAEAETLLLAAYPGLVAGRGPAHRYATSTAEGLAKIYRKRGHAAQAAEWEKKAKGAG